MFTIAKIARVFFKLNGFTDYLDSSGGVFVEDYWLRMSQAYLDDVDTYDFNPGQNTIWYSYMKPALEYYCQTEGQNYTVEGCINYVVSDIGDDKANALSETLAQIAVDLEFLWDNAYGGDNYQDKWFLGLNWDL
jgi:hypothetical protein